MVVSRSVSMVRQPRGSCIVTTSLEVATPENEINSCDAVIHMQKKSVSKAALCRVQPALHVTRRTPHGALRLVQAVSAWSVKPRRAPSRHCRDARVYGHTTTPIYGMSTPPRDAS